MLEMSDPEAIRLCSSGERGREAFRVLYQRYARSIFGFAKKILGEAALAEDAVQETFIRFYHKRGEVDPDRPLTPYLLRIAHNVALNLIRARKRAGEPRPGAERADSSPSVPRSASRRELKEAVAAALLELAPEHRSILALRHFEGLKQRELAEVLGCTERTARNRLRAAGVLLERALRKRGIVDQEESR